MAIRRPPAPPSPDESGAGRTLAILRAERQRLKLELREFERVFARDNGRPPSRSSDWTPVLGTYKEYARLSAAVTTGALDRQRERLSERELVHTAAAEDEEAEEPEAEETLSVD